MNTQPGPWQRPSGRGFTLVELLLTVTLLLLMIGAGVMNFGTLQSGSRLEEGATQVESLFRYARARASSSGRSVKIVFATDLGLSASLTNFSQNPGPQVLWESDPLGAPGRFDPMPDATPYTEQILGLVQVQNVRKPTADSGGVTEAMDPRGHSEITGDPGGVREAVSDSPQDSLPLAIMFYPDGSSDSIEVILESRDDQDHRRMSVTLSGLAGSIRRRQLEVDEGQPKAEPPPSFR